MTSPTSSANASSVPNSGTKNIDALLSGDKWGASLGTSVVLSYSFPWQNGLSANFAGYNGQPYSTLNENSATQHFGFNSIQVAATVNALTEWTNAAKITFTQIVETSTNVGDLRFAFTSAIDKTSTGENAWGWAGYPDSYWPSAGDIWVSTASSGYTDTDWTVGSYNFYSLIHEIGHAIGLKHPFEGSSQLAINLDSRLYTVMSYTDVPNSLFVKVIQNANGSASWSSFTVVPETLMLLDIAAIQYLYGINTSYKAGDDIYTFDTRTPFFKTIWDGGGKDTVSVANFKEGCEVNLNAGAFSKITIKSDSTAGYDWKSQPPTPTYDGTNNLCIAYGVEIENVIGGSGNDKLTGNSANNSLDGGAGNDVMYGGAGNDTFDWGAANRDGNDIFYGGIGDDVFVLDFSNDTVIEYSNEGNDTVWVDFEYSISSLPNIENLYGYSSKNLTLTGNVSSNYLKGGSGNDKLFGGSGNDILFAWNGDDSITGGGGDDFVDGGNGTDYAYFADNYSTSSISFNGVSFSVATRTQGTDTLKNVEFAVFSDYTYNLSEFYKPPTYTLTATSRGFNEGGNAVFNLTTTKTPVGTALTYTISGISKSDLTAGGLTGTTIVGADGKSVINIPIYADRLTEGSETIAITIQGSTGYASIIDTSVGKGPAASDLVYVFKSEKTGPAVNPASYSYYYTSDVDEVNYINAQANWPWVQKPSTFEAAHSNPTQSTPVFKFWSDKLQAPYFTISTAERDQIISWSATGKNGYDWKYAGTGFSVYTSAAPTDEMGKNAIPVFCVWMDDTDFNPTNGLSGGLLFTADKTEYEGLVKLVGVTGAGVVFYGEVPGN